MRKFFFISISMLMLNCSPGKQTMHTSSFADNPVVAHRGAFKKNLLPENSIASLKEAIRLGCTGSEFDIHMTADDSLVINHDPVFHQLEIEKTDYATLVAFRLSNDEKLPTLQAYLQAGSEQNTKTQLVLEIKPSIISKERGLLIAEKVVELVQKMQLQKKVSYISFDYGMVKRIHQLDSSAITQYLNGDKTPTQLYKDGISGADYHYSVFKKNPHWIAEAKQLGILLNVWTVNKAEDLNWFLNEGFNYISTNEPELLFNLLDQKK